MKKLLINPIDSFLKEIIFFISFVIFLFVSFAFLLANENSLKLVNATGRSVIINNDLDAAKKRALEEALYLASLQGGAKVDGFSSIDNQTNLNENLLVRPASEIIDFTILEEVSDKTHFSVRIQAALMFNGKNITCNQRKRIKLSYLQPHFNVSSKLPAWTNELPGFISEKILRNISSYDDIEVIDMQNFFIKPENLSGNNGLSYSSIMGNNVNIKNGEFSIIPLIEISSGKSRLHRFSQEILFSIKLRLFQGPNYKIIENINYNFSLITGNKTGYPHLDAFYKIPIDRLINQIDLSLSKLHFRVLDQLKCVPLETTVAYKNQELIAPLGTNQGLYTGRIGIISNNNPDNSMENWSVVSVSDANLDYSILETLNSKMDKKNLDGKLIRFID